MVIEVVLEGERVPIDGAVFKTLLDNSVAGTYADYDKAVATGAIQFSTLLWLARKGEIPYPLFFAPLPLVEAQVALKTKKLLAGISKDTFQIGTRDEVRLRDVDLIVRDLMRKQKLVVKSDRSLTKNKIIGMLGKSGTAPEEDAARVMSALGVAHTDLQACRDNDTALALLIEHLEENQILVSQSVHNRMPQRLTGAVSFSGMTIRDAKVPYIFLAGGNHGDKQEPTGRTIFTLALMTVLIARKVFRTVTWNSQSISTEVKYEYDVAGAMLMPLTCMEEFDLSTLDGVKTGANECKVTPSAITVRAARLGLITAEAARDYLRELREEFDKAPKRRTGGNIHPWNAVRKYAGRELSRRMLRVMENGGISPKEFCRTICNNQINPNQLGELRQVIM